MHKRSAFDRLHREQAGQWVRLPDDMSSNITSVEQMQLVSIDGTSGGQVDGDPIAPIEVSGSPTRIFSGTLNSAGDIWVRANDHKRLGRLWLTKSAVYKGLLVGVYDPNTEDSENYPTSDERPLYVIDPESDGEVVARVTTTASAANWSTVSDPIPSSDGRCTTYYRGETGSTTEDETGVTFYNYFDTTIDSGSIILLEEFQGRLICTTVLSSTTQNLIAKLTGTVTARTSDSYGSASSVALGHLVAGVWTQVLTGQTVYNPSLSPVHIPSGANIQIPVFSSNGQWVLLNATDLQQVSGWTTANDQSVGHDAASTSVEWQDDSECPE